MALQTSGEITIQDIVDEFGGTTPHALSEYYRDGTYVTSNNSNIPTSGEISLTDFYGGLNFSATGGTVTTAGGYTYHTFTASSSFVINNTTSCDILIVGGGAGGCRGGGGAGGVRMLTAQSVSAGSHTITIGAGGAKAANGGNTVAFGYTSNGGSAGPCGNPASGGASGSPTSFSGGSGAGSNGCWPGGGGGGASQAGGNATYGHLGDQTAKGGPGGDGLQWVDGNYYGGGGGGGIEYGGAPNYRAPGGDGGGGDGCLNRATSNNSSYYALPGDANTGGGGGGGNNTSVSGPWSGFYGMPSAAGGSGVVIVRYAL